MRQPIEQVLQEIAIEVKPFLGEGKIADYIPALKDVNPNKFGMAYMDIQRSLHTVGDTNEAFSMQSISKVLTLMMGINLMGPDIWKRVGKEPSGNKFNSLIQLELENGIPRNPFINAGALVVTDILVSHVENPKEEILAFARKISGNPNIHFDEKIAASEKATGFTNAALVNYMKSFGNIENEVETVLDVYYHQCAIMMTCEDLAQSFLVLANKGKLARTQEEVITKREAKRINALMATCGFYDQAGEFAYRVGLPGKSGVSGGIIAIHPEHYAVAVWSPELNAHGNSVLGIEALDRLTSKLEISIF